MAEADSSPPTPPPEEMHWGINYLREDLKSLRGELRQEVRDVRQEVGDLRGEVRDLRQEMHRLVDTRFYWIIGIMVTLFGMQSALMVALTKL